MRVWFEMHSEFVLIGLCSKLISFAHSVEEFESVFVENDWFKWHNQHVFSFLHSRGQSLVNFEENSELIL